jgi:hypothetical protein
MNSEMINLNATIDLSKAKNYRTFSNAHAMAKRLNDDLRRKDVKYVADVSGSCGMYPIRLHDTCGEFIGWDLR